MPKNKGKVSNPSRNNCGYPIRTPHTPHLHPMPQKTEPQSVKTTNILRRVVKIDVEEKMKMTTRSVNSPSKKKAKVLLSPSPSSFALCYTLPIGP